MSSISIGTVLRVTRAVHGIGSNNLLGKREVGWAVVYNFTTKGYPRVRWLSPSDRDLPDFLQRSPAQCDVFRVAREDDVLPDEACAQLAQLVLSGELSQ